MGVGVATGDFLVEMAQVVGGEAIGAENAYRVVGKLLGDGVEDGVDDFSGGVEDDDAVTEALLESDVLSGGVTQVVVAVDDADGWMERRKVSSHWPAPTESPLSTAIISTE